MEETETIQRHLLGLVFMEETETIQRHLLEVNFFLEVYFIRFLGIQCYAIHFFFLINDSQLNFQVHKKIFLPCYEKKKKKEQGLIFFFW